LRLHEVIWETRFSEKIGDKHGVTQEEVEEVLFAQPHVRLARRGVLGAYLVV